MKALIFTFMIVCIVSANLRCSSETCATLVATCTGICACDYPGCECCPECASCLGDMWNECCDCFDKCDFKPINKHKQLLSAAKLGEVCCNIPGPNYYNICAICCPVGQAAWCTQCYNDHQYYCVCGSNPCH